MLLLLKSYLLVDIYSVGGHKRKRVGSSSSSSRTRLTNVDEESEDEDEVVSSMLEAAQRRCSFARKARIASSVGWRIADAQVKAVTRSGREVRQSIHERDEFY